MGCGQLWGWGRAPSLHQLLAIPDLWVPGSELALEEPPGRETANE